MRWVIALVATLTFASQPAAAQSPEPVQLMVLGTYHMGNPGQDLANMEADDVTQPRRQAELAAVTDALAAWRPTRILIEWQVPAPFTVTRYRDFTPAELATNRNEVVQIGFRLAHQLGHSDVYGFDEQPGEGEPNYFQYDRIEAYANAHGLGAMNEAQMAFFRGKTEEMQRAQASHSIAELLLRENDPEAARADNMQGYYYALPMGDADNQVGAEFNAYWYMRNAKMFAKIALIAQPGDRVLVLVGAGHLFWLTHFAQNMPGFTSVDPRPYLQVAAQRTR